MRCQSSSIFIQPFLSFPLHAGVDSHFQLHCHFDFAHSLSDELNMIIFSVFYLPLSKTFSMHHKCAFFQMSFFVVWPNRFTAGFACNSYPVISFSVHFNYEKSNLLTTRISDFLMQQRNANVSNEHTKFQII